ncbi:MAG: ATP-binding cassette domain-containing protein [Pyrinomonadaceae bacterium]
MSNRKENKAFIEVKGLKKSFDELLVLDKISFCINKGEILSILGPSGSGKTTLLKCLIGLETLNSSEDSIIINGLSRNDLLSKNRIAYVPQRYSNYPWLNVFGNIKLGMINHENPSRGFNIAPIHMPALRETEGEKQRHLFNQKHEQKVTEIIDLVGLTGFENYTIDKLSGGMQQRVAIGRAIAQNTDIIAMDEPFGALDFKIRESLQLLVKQLNKTYFICYPRY